MNVRTTAMPHALFVSVKGNDIDERVRARHVRIALTTARIVRLSVVAGDGGQGGHPILSAPQ